ncbi:MAG: ABC transporter substrate-binding protein [bacterium]
MKRVSISVLLMVMVLILSVAVGSAQMKYNEAPMLKELVKAGKLPPVEQRLPKEPAVVQPVEEIGQYGGTWRRAWLGRSDSPGPSRINTERLVRFTIDLKRIEPNIAKSWEISEGGKVFTFRLREGMKWSDGEPYTADDLLFWYEDMVMNDEITPAKPGFLRIGGELGRVEKVDDYTVRFRFAQPYGTFIMEMAGPNGHDLFHPKHYLKQFHPRYVAKDKLDAMTKEAGFDHWVRLFQAKNDEWMNPDRPTLGPWQVKTQATAQLFIMERNPYYWKVDPAGNQLPYIDRIVHTLVESGEIINMKAMAGEIDMQFRHLQYSNFTLFKGGEKKGDYRVVKYLDDFETNMAICPNLNHKDPVLRKIIEDKRFRFALSLAINRKEINELAYLGMCEEPRQVAPLPESPYYTEWAKKLAYAYVEYDPKKANALLDEMGLTKRDAEGFRLRPDGKTLALTIEVAAGIFGPWVDAAELIKGYWDAIGVKTAVKTEERALYYTRLYANEHDVGVWTSAAGMQPILGPRYYVPIISAIHSIQAPLYAVWHESGGTQGEEPPVGSDIRKTIDLYEQIKVTVDEREQLRLWDEIMRLNAENLWVIGTLSSPPLIGVVKNNFRNIAETGIYSWVAHSPGSFHPEQFFFKQK